MTTLLDTDRVTDIVRELLVGRFGDAFEFGPIIVERELDDYGDEYIHVYIVFNGDQRELDPSWTAGPERPTEAASGGDGLRQPTEQVIH